MKRKKNYGNEANGAVYILSKELQKFFLKNILNHMILVEMFLVQWKIKF